MRVRLFCSDHNVETAVPATLIACHFLSSPDPAHPGGEKTREGIQVAHSPHRRYRGCGHCKPHKWRGQGQARKAPWAVNRKTGLKRRWTRRYYGE